MNKAHTEPLTPRELDILQGMASGLRNAEIAQRLVLSTGTVKWYVKQLYGKLGAHSREEAVAQAAALGLTGDQFNDAQSQADTDEGCPLINLLPQDVSNRFVGHADHLARLRSLLRQPVRLISIYGRAGSGKTALACQALGDVRQVEQNTGQLSGIVCLSAASTGITLNRLFTDLGRLLVGKDQAVVDAISRNAELAPEQKIRIVLEKLAGKHIVLLLDNLETVQNADTGELVEPSLQSFVEMCIEQSSSLTLLITSRVPLLLPRALSTWENVFSLEDGLPVEDAVALLRRFDPSGVAGIRDAPAGELGEVARHLGGFPRALESVAGMLLEDPLMRLADVRRTVSLLQGDISVAVVQQALEHLGEDALRVLAALAIFGQPVSYEALAYLLAPYLAGSVVRSILGRLTRACFVKANRAAQQIAIHPIDQAWCYNHIPTGSPHDAASEPAPFTRAALHRRAAKYYHERRLPRAQWRHLADLDPHIQEFRQWVSAGDADGAARVLLEIDRDHLWEWGYRDLLRQLYATVDEHVLDPRLALQVARRRAWLHFFDAPRAADQEFTRVLAEARRQGFVQEEADALDDLAQTFRRGDRDREQGIAHHLQALALYRQVGDRRGEADALGGLGAIFTLIDPEVAIDYLLAAADIQRDLDNANSLSFVYSMLGAAYQGLGALDHAMEMLEEAARLARESGSLSALGRAYGDMACLWICKGNIERGRACIDDAIAVTREYAGVAFTYNQVFFACVTAVYMALAHDAPGGIQLMERTIQDLSESLPRSVPFAKLFLSLVLLLGGDVRQARSLLPSDIGVVMHTMSTNYICWIGVLLIKTGETETAVAFFKTILAMNTGNDSGAPGAVRDDAGSLAMIALACAGRAFLEQDTGMAATAADLARRAIKIRNVHTYLLCALIGLLMQEPGSKILTSVSDRLASIPTLGILS